MMSNITSILLSVFCNCAHFLQLTMNVKAFQTISSVIQKTLGARMHENSTFHTRRKLLLKSVEKMCAKYCSTIWYFFSFFFTNL